MSNTEDRVKKIVAEQLGIEQEKIKPESSFVEDLGADSLDTVELVMALEEEFETEISDSEAEGITTVKLAIDYIDQQSAAKSADESSSVQTAGAEGNQDSTAQQAESAESTEPAKEVEKADVAESTDKVDPVKSNTEDKEVVDEKGVDNQRSDAVAPQNDQPVGETSPLKKFAPLAIIILIILVGWIIFGSDGENEASVDNNSGQQSQENGSQNDDDKAQQPEVDEKTDKGKGKSKDSVNEGLDNLGQIVESLEQKAKEEVDNLEEKIDQEIDNLEQELENVQQEEGGS